MTKKDVEEESKKYYQMFCGSSVIATLELSENNIVSMETDVHLFVDAVKDLLGENKREETLLDFLLLALNIHFEFYDWFKVYFFQLENNCKGF